MGAREAAIRRSSHGTMRLRGSGGILLGWGNDSDPIGLRILLGRPNTAAVVGDRNLELDGLTSSPDWEDEKSSPEKEGIPMPSIELVVIGRFEII